MRSFYRIFQIALIAIPLLAMRQDKPLRVIFFGDSITQAGVGPTGYITKMTEMLKIKNQSGQYELIGAGIGGNKVYDLYLRLEDDVLSKKPDVVFIYVGINDVWHKSSHGTGTDPDKYVKFYEALIKKMKAQNIRVIVCTPTVIGERNDNSNAQDGDLNYYSKLIREIATRNNVQLCDLRKYFGDYLAQNNPENKEKGVLTSDRVHLTDEGNKFLADRMMEALVKTN
ncbi:SGNH/GDSL hydrolase family protein [Dyadobacter psychrotolerans]|uniref:G-D-S-L family lipolytic protein n=1 Tax=Dyadobacter psychrotolerans TaxID=2541721 RepID=A0A4R5DQ18_9BACT|nr:GDSL-type esterase/lipase family protein [Dyadobacter psychrotolerans]TDE12883.1 G-D-S-L family lipolytic protein [Dyadobacter psychrotolerans]